MATFLLICIFLHCLLQGCMGLTCLLMKNCTLQLEDLINRTHETEDISTMIPLCLNVVGKQSELQNCEMNAVKTCGLGGHEPEYQSYSRKKFEAKKKCLKDCPNLNDVKICQGYIQYDIIQTSGYSEFCSNYNYVQSTCVDTKLNTCSFRYQLFESGLSEDGRRIVQTICQSGCSTIDMTMTIIDNCNKEFVHEARRFSECSSYIKYINCIKTGAPCPQFRRVAQYTQPALLEAQTKCEPSTMTSMAPPTSTIVPQTIPATTRAVVTVEDRQGQTRTTTMGLQDTKTIVSRDKELLSTTKSTNPATRNTITTTSFSGHSTTEENVKHTTNVMTSMSNKGEVLKKQNSSSIVLQTIPTSTRTVGTVEDRHGQNRGTTMGLKDTKTSVSEDIEDKEFVTTTKSSNPATRNIITTTSFSGHSTTEENVKHTTNVMTSMSNKENILKKQNSSSIESTEIIDTVSPDDDNTMKGFDTNTTIVTNNPTITNTFTDALIKGSRNSSGSMTTVSNRLILVLIHSTIFFSLMF